MDKDLAEYAMFLAAQTGLLIWTISGMRSDQRNLAIWVQSIAKTSSRTALRLAAIEGRLHIEPLPDED